MSLQPIKDINEYKRIKDELKAKFESERSGDQDLLREHTKLFQPLITAHKETSKAIEDKIVQESVSNALVPLVTELQRRNDQVDMLSEQPYYQQEIPAISGPLDPIQEVVKIDFDQGLNDTDKENLQDLSLELPSIVFENKTFEETLEKIKTENRSIGQRLGKGAPSKNVTEKEKELYESRKATLEVYREKIINLQGATKQFVSTPKKKGEGLTNKIFDIVLYSNVDDLCVKLSELDAAKKAGNTGLDNKIISILDELLRTNAIKKDEYNNLYRNIFI
jgi:hypothetical protein